MKKIRMIRSINVLIVRKQSQHIPINNGIAILILRIEMKHEKSLNYHAYINATKSFFLTVFANFA